MSRSVAVLSTIPSLSLYLRQALPSVTFLDVPPGSDGIVTTISNSEILVADVNLLIPYVDHLPAVKWVQATWAGLDSFLPIIKNKNVSYTITRFSGKSFGYAMSEYVVSQIVNFERDQKQQYENQTNRVWSQDGRISNHRRLNDLTVGILGIGEIGNFIAKVLKAFGTTVWGMSRSVPTKKNENLDRHVTTEHLPEILKSCDYIINVMPSTDNTRGMLNGDILENCSNKKSVFINIGRGSVIKEVDLVNALEKNWISGAILDVFEEEPLSKTSKLWQLPKVVITPHVSGISRPDDIAKVFAENYIKYLNGETLKNVVDVDRGY